MIYLIICLGLCLKVFDKSFMTGCDKLCKAHQTLVFCLQNTVSDINLVPVLKYTAGDFHGPSSAHQQIHVTTSHPRCRYEENLTEVSVLV